VTAGRHPFPIRFGLPLDRAKGSAQASNGALTSRNAMRGAIGLASGAKGERQHGGSKAT
jgi:hypothetical protein